MTPDEYKFLFQLEERHWWFVGMRRVVAALLDGLVPSGPLRILDAGCGTGLMMAWFRRYGHEAAIFGIDVDTHAVRYTSERGERRVVQGSIAAMPFPAAVFDMVTSFDVLDSFRVEDAAAPFAELGRVLRPGGVLLVRVPAFQFLHSQHDRAVNTAHRFTAGELRARLEGLGLEVKRLTYANSILFPFAAAWRGLTRSGRPDPQSDVRPLPKGLGWLNTMLAWPFTLEALWLRCLPWRLPFGLSVIALARKPAGPK